MAVEHKDVAIAIWVICAVVLVVVVSLAIFLFSHRRRRRAMNQKRHRYLKSLTFDAHTDASGDAQGTDGGSLYLGFQRLTTEELEATPSPDSALSFSAPLVVHLRARAERVYTDACDILLTVDRLRDSRQSDRSGCQILGNDGYYHNNYLLYTTPLEFFEPGVYAIQAHTVHPVKEAVGVVHQFVYVVTGIDRSSGLAPPLSSGDRPLLTYASGSAHTNHVNSIDIDIARRQAERAQPNGSAFQQNANADPCGCNHPSLAMVPPSAGRTGDMPLPPEISPSEGEVMTSTEIVITPHRQSTSPDQIRYSIDGSYPTLVYTGPFKLSLPPPSLLPSQRREVIVQAIAVHAAAAVASNEGSTAISAYSRQVGFGVSGITRAVLWVQPAGLSYFDPQVPTPSVRLRTTDATLYFDESNNPPHAQTLYEIVFVNDARRKVKFSRQRAQLYDRQPVKLTEDVATVHAWTVMNASAAAGWPEDSALADAADRVRSVATIYDCSRAATEHGKVSRQRVEQYNLRPEQLLPPPVICVSCSELDLAFDDPPANGRIAYTLNSTEPALLDVNPPACAVPLGGSAPSRGERQRRGGTGDDHVSPIRGDSTGAHTLVYKPGRYIHVTLMETQPVYLTARVFVPILESSDGTLHGDTGAQGGSGLGSGRLLGYRYGGVFHRGFHFNSS
ncbi:hypothetical protein JKF63_04870 [Porcisia hertigi]|uniref:GH29D-like beta-sandwich domain-containing protein n=1 Tax=Porcisia hertigi TaxID=2761500 RepID=A0A836IVE6_9TRYP|nr:hypothetical protein JKF63_04870 [Porcisia hertigi]